MLNRAIPVLLLILFCSLVYAGDIDPLALRVCQQTCADFSNQFADDLHDIFLEKGIVGAIKICAERNRSGGEEFSHAPGLEVERLTLLTLKQRNLLDSFEAKTLRAMHDSVTAGGAVPEEAYEWTGQDGSEGTLVYMKPILVEPLCLSCHGPAEMVQPDVREIMQKNYNALPSGNKIGDVKGAIVVTLKLPEGQKLLEKAEEQDTQE